MKQSLLRTVCYLIYCLTLCNISFVAAQRLNAPDLSFTYACVKDNFNSFNTIVSFEERIFNSDNSFILELSDANGDFNNPSVLKTINDQNYSFAFETTFALPLDISGEGYMLRVRATSPEMVGPASQAFHAFYVPEATLVLNNYTDVAICGGNTATISLNQEVAASYIWYRNGNFYKEGGSSINVSSSGDYYAEPYYGDCTGSIYSNIINVSFGDELSAAIVGSDVVESCEGTTHIFKASITDSSLEYQWFLDGNRIENLPNYAPELAVDVNQGSYGDYTLKLINVGGCEAISQEVRLQPKTTSETISAVSPLENILLDGQSTVLKIATSSTNPRITWYKDEQLLNNGGTFELNVSQPGAYFARVTAAGSCTGIIESPVFTVMQPVSFTAAIAHANNYETCFNTKTSLELQSIIAIAENGLEVRVSENLYTEFNLNWKKNGTAINHSQSILSLNSYNENGDYKLEASYGDIQFTTNTLSVQLGIPENDIISDTDFICSNNGAANFSITNYNGAVYNWYLGEKLIRTSNESTFTATEAGSYSVETIYKGCAVFSDYFELKPFGEDVVEIFPSQQVYIQTGGSENVFAKGADSYQWIDSKGMVVSTSNSFIAMEEGTFYLVAQKDGCEIRKEVTVAISDVTEVPNIITPNQDNINDKWVLPAKFVNDPDIEVMICDTYGKPVLKTKAYQNNWPMNTASVKYEASIYYYNIHKNGESLKKGSITVVNR
ncbi:gliding motility-associated C-terminal domain-containing protein [Ascidiimonas sp. W6]|uniref:T9SS type B sorting domain-containing protein n=1 Tax=Ascidiimonas meishanensis TaxID=3128903 RepID=UPI0030EEB566